MVDMVNGGAGQWWFARRLEDLSGLNLQEVEGIVAAEGKRARPRRLARDRSQLVVLAYETGLVTTGSQ
jgi:hypothetical protein